jgi:hypothetical protein
VSLLGRSDAPYAALAREMKTSEGALKVAIHRLRKRYRDLFRQEIADTVADPTEIESELRYLAAVLTRNPPAKAPLVGRRGTVAANKQCQRQTTCILRRIALAGCSAPPADRLRATNRGTYLSIMWQELSTILSTYKEERGSSRSNKEEQRRRREEKEEERECV